RMTLTTRASVPTLYRSLKHGSTVSASRGVITPTSALSRPASSSTSRTLRGRPTLMGTTDMGNRTGFLSGRIPIVSGSWYVGGAGISISSTRSRDAWHEPTPRFLPPVQSLFCRACGNRLLMRRSAILLPCLLSFWLACSAQKPVESPKQVLDAYAQALKAGRTQEAYDLLSDQAKNSISFEAFQR